MILGDQLVSTIPERCRVCYTCVRDCPAKAIRISNGQAEVIRERCIGCGNCVQVCSQKAKRVHDSIPEVRALRRSGRRMAAIVAPSFPAEFSDVHPRHLVGMLRRLGFDLVVEVAFGADLVARRYRQLLDEDRSRRWIATTCPAIVTYIEKYHPDLVPHLAPVASPMTATARALHELHGDDLAIVFIGPCLAKKVEAARRGEHPEVDSALTFRECRDLLRAEGIGPDADRASDFDPPHPGLGAIFPISGGMPQTAGIQEDLLTNEVITATGIENFTLAIAEFEKGALDARLLEMLSCRGCIMGAGMSTDAPLFRRRTAVSQYARRLLSSFDPGEHKAVLSRLSRLDMGEVFAVDDTRMPSPSDAELAEILHRLGKDDPEDELNCGACGYATCREHAVAIHKGLAETEMCLPYTVERLRDSLDELHASHEQLATVRQALINAEKLASMGQLSAGIAHEVNNPLGVILLYANMMLDDHAEGTEQREDLEMIVEQAERCKKVVSGLLNFARKNKVSLRSVDVENLVDRCLKAIIVPEKVELAVEHEMADPVADVDGDQLIQVISNLVVNAIEAMPGGGRITVTTRSDAEEFQIMVRDDGTGIAKEHLSRIFEPLYTTKQMGKGTGLGLAVTYGIVKMHRGRIDVFTNDDPAAGSTGTTFKVSLPRFSPALHGGEGGDGNGVRGGSA